MGWPQVILFVISLAVSYYMRPDPEQPTDAVPAGLGELDVPTAEDGRPVPVLFGRRHIKSPNVVWYGHLRTEAIREKAGGK